MTLRRRVPSGMLRGSVKAERGAAERVLMLAECMASIAECLAIDLAAPARSAFYVLGPSRQACFRFLLRFGP